MRVKPKNPQAMTLAERTKSRLIKVTPIAMSEANALDGDAVDVAEAAVEEMAEAAEDAAAADSSPRDRALPQSIEF